MTAVFIVLIALALAALYNRLLNKMDGELLMALGVQALVPWAVIAVGAIVALVTLT